MLTLTAANLKSYFDANPATYKPTVQQQPDVKSDGYLCTPHIYNLLTGSYATAGDFTVPSSAGAYLLTAGGAANPLSSLIGSYGPGTAGAALQLLL
ncbi:MAG: hypothetical protein KGO96_14195, partial [Elusimicrobia bacterium]|nr:hypothetical protein [Elusimicrobiota bacterium]